MPVHSIPQARETWAPLVANDEQMLGTRVVRVLDGTGDGARVLEAWTPSGLSVDVLLDRSFDLFTVRLDGRPVSWLGPPGLKPRTQYEPAGFGWLNTFHGGLLVTCGLDHFGGPISRQTPEHIPPDDRMIEFGEHGRISHESARLVSCDVATEGRTETLRLVGVVTQASLYASQLEMRRTIDIGINEATIRISDTVRNIGPLRTRQASLYHINFGYPLVQPGSVITAQGVDGRYEETLAPCTPTAAEVVTPWQLAYDDEHVSQATIMSPDGRTVRLSYSARNLPSFLYWKLHRTRANVVGFAPASAPDPSEADWLEPGHTREYDLVLTIDDKDSRRGTD